MEAKDDLKEACERVSKMKDLILILIDRMKDKPDAQAALKLLLSWAL